LPGRPRGARRRAEQLGRRGRGAERPRRLNTSNAPFLVAGGPGLGGLTGGVEQQHRGARRRSGRGSPGASTDDRQRGLVGRQGR
jgi:hypothetical protein